MNGIGVLCGILTSIAHSFSSSALSLFAGPLINKTYSRYWDSFFSIDQITRLLLLFFILGNLSFAVSSNLVGEISALIGLFPIDSLWLVSYLLSRFLSTFWRSLILNRKLPYHSCYSPSNYIEFLVLCRLLIMNHFRGVGSIGFSFARLVLVDWLNSSLFLLTFLTILFSILLNILVIWILG